MNKIKLTKKQQQQKTNYYIANRHINISTEQISLQNNLFLVPPPSHKN